MYCIELHQYIANVHSVHMVQFECYCCYIIIPLISQNTPMSDELKELPKEEGGIFSRVAIVLSKIHPPHTVS